MDKLICVEPSQVSKVWQYVEGTLTRAFRKSDLQSIEDSKSDVLSGNALLWIVWDGFQITAAGITKIIKPHHTKICILVACAGRANWQSIADKIEDYARAEGCAITRIYGRPGWKRVLIGYKQSRVILDKEI